MPQDLRGGDELVPLYRAMVRARAFDAKAIALQRTGRLGTYASASGEEAVGVGAAYAMRPEDVLIPGHRNLSAQLLRGVTPLELLLWWGGDERGNDFAGPRHDLPVAIPIASQVPHAAGIALAMQIRGEPRVAMCLLGDGATSKGDFSEAVNIAGAMKLPVVFVVANNQWAISVPRSAQTAAETLAQKAIAAGIAGEQVDGNDVVAVAAVASNAIATARNGGGPTLIEALTYRLGDHTTVDDSSRYRDPAEVSAHWKAEPVARLRTYLVALDVWGREAEQQLLTACAAEVEAAAESFLATVPEPPEAMFDHLYAQLPGAYASQRATVAGEARDA